MPECAYLSSILVSPTATIVAPGVPTVKVNGKVISVLQDNTSDGGKMVMGSSKVTAGGKPVCRKGDKNDKGKTVTSNVSSNVTVGG